MKIQVVPYDPSWSRQFALEKQELLSALGDVVERVHHIGSTSVPGLAAKPIIDILLEVTSIAELEENSESMRVIGYEVMGEFGIPRRRYFRKGLETRTHHVHAFAAGDLCIDRHMAFRDYLRSNPDVAHEYGLLKTSVASECNGDLAAYSDGKDGFIKRIEAIALREYASQPGNAGRRLRRR